jgi:SanA protein
MERTVHSRGRVRARTSRPARAQRRAILILRIALVIASIFLLTVAALRLYTINRYRALIIQPEQAPIVRDAIVFGAGIRPNGEPTPVLYDRVATAVELFHEGRVERLILSGDGRSVYHDEPAVMRRVALQLGVPDDAIVLDTGGIRTFETCRRARDAFGIERAVLVTQGFHLPRALMLCASAEIDVVGVASDRRAYPLQSRLSWQLRETAATVLAWWDVTETPSFLR